MRIQEGAQQIGKQAVEQDGSIQPAAEDPQQIGFGSTSSRNALDGNEMCE
jgi:hypothetical protein